MYELNANFDILKPLIIVSDSNLNQVIIDNKAQTTGKSLNIPVCDILIDEEYDKNITTPFHLSPGYLRYIRKVLDESDILTDYFVDTEDEEWLKQLKNKFPDENMDVEKFEFIISLLEKVNGATKDSIPQSVALNILLDKSGWSQLTVYKLLPDIYKYWVTKKEKIGKPLTRRYWPPVPATETDPLQVFRVRDKERYRLRRQYRKNDLDSFRKMQQLRKEFLQAKSIFQLMLEREKLGEAQFKVHNALFEQEIQVAMITSDTANSQEKSEIDNGQIITTAAPSSSSELPTVYEPQFRHLWQPITILGNGPTSADNTLLDMEDGGGGDEIEESVDGFGSSSITSLKRTSSSLLKQRSIRSIGSDDGRSSIVTLEGPMRKSIGGTVTSTMTNSITGIPPISMPLLPTGENKRGRKSKAYKEKLLLYAMQNGTVEVMDGGGPGGVGVGIGGVTTTVTTNNTTGQFEKPTSSMVGRRSTIPSDDPLAAFLGYSRPSILEIIPPLQPTTSSSTVPSSNTTAIGGTPGTTEVPLIHECMEGPRTVCRPDVPHFLSPLICRDEYKPTTTPCMTPLEYLQSLELQYDETNGNREVKIPIKYRARCRVGRNGRVIVDRIPVYDSASDSASDDAADAAEDDEDEMLSGYGNYLDTTRLSTKYNASFFPSSSSSSSYRFQYPQHLYNNNKHRQHPSHGITGGGGAALSGATIGSIPPIGGGSNIKALTASNLSTHMMSTNNSNSNTSGPMLHQQQQHKMTPKQLTEIPPSNRKLFLNLKKAGRGMFNNYCWSSSAIPPFSYIPPLLPVRYEQHQQQQQQHSSYEKKIKLAKILAESDSEDEIVIIPDHYLGDGNAVHKTLLTDRNLSKLSLRC